MAEGSAAPPAPGDVTRSALCVLALAVPWLYPFASGPTPSVEPGVVAAGCAAALWWAFPSLRIPRGLLAALGLLLLAIVARGGGISPEAAMAVGACAVVAGCAGVSSQTGSNSRLGSWIAGAWLVAALLSCVIALCQYFAVADRFAPLMTVPAVPEAFANLRQRNQFASLTAIGMAALLWFVTRGLALRLALPAALLLALGNAASASRTGAVQLLLLAMLAWYWSGPAVRRQAPVLGAALLAYLGGSLLLPPLQEALAGTQSQGVLQRFTSELGCSSRRVLWANVLDLIREQPLWGWGWGELDYAHFSHLYQGARFCDILDNAHNLPLHFAVELGIPVAALLCTGLAWLVLRGAPWRETDPLRQLGWSVLAAILLHSMVEYPLWYGPFQMALGICIGWVWPRERPSVHVFPATGRLMASLMAGLTLYAGWDYHRVSQIYLPAEARSPAYRDDTLDKIRPSWLFRNQVRFAELTMEDLSRANAAEVYAMAGGMLHYSPESRVIEKRLESALLLGRNDEAVLELARYRAAFPDEYRAWKKARPASAAGAP